MFCKNCGNELNGSQKFCNNCGTLNDQYVEAPTEPTVEETPSENTFMNTQPFSIEEVAQKVEENKMEESAPKAPIMPEATVTPVETVPVADTPTEEPKPAAPETPNYSVPEATISSEPVTSMVPEAPKKKSNTGFIVIVIVLIALILGIGGFILFKVLGNKTDTPTVTPSTPNTNNNSNNNNTNNNNTNNNTSTASYKYNGYKFDVPSGLTILEQDGKEYVVLTGKYQYRGLYLNTTSNYDYYKTNIDQVTNTLKSQMSGGTYLSTSEQTFDGKDFLVVSFYYGTLYNDFAFTSLPDGNLIEFGVYYENAAEKTDAYKSLAKMIKTATKDTSTSYNDTNSTYSAEIVKDIQ